MLIHVVWFIDLGQDDYRFIRPIRCIPRPLPPPCPMHSILPSPVPANHAVRRTPTFGEIISAANVLASSSPPTVSFCPRPPETKLQLSREQTGFVEGVWKERRRLESELDARRQEVERLRASEDAARTAAAVLDGKVEDMSAALRQEKARAKREAEAAVAAEARDAMEALRRQLDDLRKEVDRTKPDQLDGGEVRGRGSPNPNGAGSGFSAADGAGPRGVRWKGESATAVGGGAVASPSSPPSLAVLEAEFQRLRAKYEKAKGRIVALEELVAASRRVSAQARREFQVCVYVGDVRRVRREEGGAVRGTVERDQHG